MTKATIVTRKRGRPSKEESTAIAMEKAMISLRGELARLTPKALLTLEGLLSSGTEKVKETTAKYILEQAKEVHNLYVEEDNQEDSDETPSFGGSAGQANLKSVIPLTTEIREYKITGTDEE